MVRRVDQLSTPSTIEHNSDDGADGGGGHAEDGVAEPKATVGQVDRDLTPGCPLTVVVPDRVNYPGLLVRSANRIHRRRP